MMKGLHSRLLFSLLCLVSSIVCLAQVPDSTLQQYSSRYEQERAYLHYDKTTYAAGETIWFKAYLMEGIYPAENSRTLYIDWIDESGNLLRHHTAPIVAGGITNGQFEVPLNYTGSMIHVRAYTQWMLNFDTAFLYKKSIRILSKSTAKTAMPLPAIVPSLELFPEGGDLIAGIKNKVVFKANDQWGRPVRIRGFVQRNGTNIDTLNALHDGMGYFFITPEASASYTVKWKDAKGVDHVATLPSIKATGVNIQVAIGAQKRLFSVRRSEAAPEELKRLSVKGTMHQVLVFKAEVNLSDKTVTSGSIPTEQLPAGVLTITVFDATGKPVAERITYINKSTYSLPAEMTVQRWGLSKRARNEVEIALPPNSNANLSIAVTDAAIERDSSDNIISHLLLTGDLKGDVYNPNYYFQNNSDSIAQHLDLLMLTHGWRRFRWNELIAGKFPAIQFPRDSSYLTLSGKLFGISPSRIKRGDNMIMMVKQTDTAKSSMVITDIQPDGSFSSPDYVFFDSLRVYYKPSKGLEGASANFMTNRLAAQSYRGKVYASLFPDTAGSYRHFLLAQEAAELAEKAKGKTLETVTVRARTKTPTQILDEKYASGLFKGSDGYQFDLLNDPFALGSQNIFTYLQGKVAGLQINTNGGTPSLQWRGGAPLLYLDEMSSDPNMLSNISTSDIAYVKVFRPPFIGFGGGSYGNGSNGAIAIYTRKGGDMKAEPGKGLEGSTVMGYTAIREFYSPNYGSFSPKNDDRDVRTTIYWHPQLIITPTKNKATIVFYNNDVTKAFRVVIEGMTKEGELIHMDQLME